MINFVQPFLPYWTSSLLFNGKTMGNDCFFKTAAQCSWKKFLKWSLTSIQCPRWNFDFRNLQQAARKAKYCFSSIELLVNLTSNMAADCFEWVVEIMIFIAELIQHHYEYTSHAYPLLCTILDCVILYCSIHMYVQAQKPFGKNERIGLWKKWLKQVYRIDNVDHYYFWDSMPLFQSLFFAILSSHFFKRFYACKS